MPTSSSSKELAKLLVLLEATEKEINHGPDFALKQLARLHEEAKAEVANPDPPIRCEGARARAALGPPAGDLVLLADPCLVLT